MASPKAPDAPADPRIAAEKARRESVSLNQLSRQDAKRFGISGSTNISKNGSNMEKFDLSKLNQDAVNKRVAELEAQKAALVNGDRLSSDEFDDSRVTANQRIDQDIAAAKRTVTAKDTDQYTRQKKTNSIVDLTTRRRNIFGVTRTK